MRPVHRLGIDLLLHEPGRYLPVSTIGNPSEQIALPIARVRPRHRRSGCIWMHATKWHHLPLPHWDVSMPLAVSGRTPLETGPRGSSNYPVWSSYIESMACRVRLFSRCSHAIARGSRHLRVPGVKTRPPQKNPTSAYISLSKLRFRTFVWPIHPVQCNLPSYALLTHAGSIPICVRSAASDYRRVCAKDSPKTELFDLNRTLSPTS
jgi:hypothetical protein